MRGFIFRLERVLRLRLAQKKQVQLALSGVYGELNRLDAGRADKDRIRRQARRSGKRDLAELFCQRIDQELAALEAREDSLCAQAAALLARLDHATARVRALERLREKRLARHVKKERARAESQRELFARNRSGPLT